MINEYSLKEDGFKQVSANFKVREFACKDGTDKILIDSQLVVILQRLREHFGLPVYICSGYRNQIYNTFIGGDPYSNHMTGQAGDIDIGKGDTLVNPLIVAIAAELMGVKRIGVYTYSDGTSWIHIGSRTDIRIYYRQFRKNGIKIQKNTFMPILKRQYSPFIARDEVKIIQQILYYNGFYSGKIDGKFGLTTKKAVMGFQYAVKIEVDGIIGAVTWKRLMGV